ncbi:uncharacterized protein LOC119546949 [Drosophila subpulchrella]|uniref:uncharacterized protein LOC119546949 n=1 Tax=Drosophila subpulchrella TaxID=1486046 RepID=UPI0018A17477|nr:uncharacterized protein LOC119546949 [Drosophila subpulchrella]
MKNTMQIISIFLFVFISLMFVFHHQIFLIANEIVGNKKEAENVEPTKTGLSAEITQDRSDILKSILKPKLHFNEEENGTNILTSNEFPLASRVDPENNNSKLKKIGEMLYYIEGNEKLDWFYAIDKCESMGSRLLSLQSERQWQDITVFLEPKDNYWVDISNVLSDCGFLSETTGQKAKFINFKIDDTNSISNSESCIELGANNNHYMNPVDCSNQNFYICEADENNDNVNI